MACSDEDDDKNDYYYSYLSGSYGDNYRFALDADYDGVAVDSKEAYVDFKTIDNKTGDFSLVDIVPGHHVVELKDVALTQEPGEPENVESDILRFNKTIDVSSGKLQIDGHLYYKYMKLSIRKL